MALTSSFGFTNTTASTHAVTPVDIEPLSDYARTADEPTSCEMKNTTCPLGQGEVLSFNCNPIKSVETKQDILNPAKVTSGIQYQVRLDEILRTVDGDGNVVADDPIVMYLNVRHTNSSYITDTMIATIFTRLCGALQKDDGTYRFKDLMLSALAPTVD